MELFNHLQMLDRLDGLIHRRATGTPEQLAVRLEICERTVYRLISDLKDLGFPVAYDKNAHTYYYKAPVKMHFELRVNDKEILNIRGGQ